MHQNNVLKVLLFKQNVKNTISSLTLFCTHAAAKQIVCIHRDLYKAGHITTAGCSRFSAQTTENLMSTVYSLQLQHRSCQVPCQTPQSQPPLIKKGYKLLLIV